MDKQICEFCGKKTYVASTMIFSKYCIECIEITIEQCKEAIRELRRK